MCCAFSFSLLCLLMWGTRLLDTEALLTTQTQTLNVSQNMVSILKNCWLCWYTPTHFCFSAGWQSWHFTDELDSLLLLPTKFRFVLVFFFHRPPGMWWKLISDTSKIILMSKMACFTTSQFSVTKRRRYYRKKKKTIVRTKDYLPTKLCWLKHTRKTAICHIYSQVSFIFSFWLISESTQKHLFCLDCLTGLNQWVNIQKHTNKKCNISAKNILDTN